LIWHDEGFLLEDFGVLLILFADDCGSGVKLLQVEDDGILDVNVCLCKNIVDTYIE
jgi:hypothetical protein